MGLGLPGRVQGEAAGADAVSAPLVVLSPFASGSLSFMHPLALAAPWPLVKS